MTTPASGTGSFSDDSPREDVRLFELLDSYLSSLHAGDLETRSAFFDRCPELARWLRCLELLDRIAPAQPNRNASLAAEAQDGQSFGKYHLQDEVGRGGMGVVFRALQTDLNRTVALKMILSSRLASTDDVRRFYAEARAAGSLRHPNIVAIHEAGEVLGQHFFAMDFVEGESLAEILATRSFDPREAARCVATIGRAVHYLHEQHIIHRDLKPSNILLAKDGTPFVTDFGLAKALGADAPHTQTGAIVGTVRYMSPEQAAGELSEISPQSDVYSLGVILFEMLTGRPPFRNPSPIDTLLEVIEGQPPRPTKLRAGIPMALEWICLKCLEKPPRHRYGSAAALVDDLERFLRGEPLQAGPPGVIRALSRWSRREPALAAHLGGLAAAALIVQVKYMISGYDRPYHMRVMALFAVWGLIAFLCDRLMCRAKRPDWIQYVWAVSDAAFLTWLLAIADGPLGPLLIGYPLLIVTTGMFFRRRLVWCMTGLCLAGYGTLLALGRETIVKSQYTLIYFAALVVIGFGVAYPAYRIRTLTRYLDDRRRGQDI
jgi:serine/threonine-protein kinase